MKYDPYTLDNIPAELEKMIEKKESQPSGYIIKYNGKRLVMKSGKKLWSTIGAAKTALICHFNWYESKYSMPPTEKYVGADGIVRQDFDYRNTEPRKAEFRDKLFSLVEIVPLKPEEE